MKAVLSQGWKSGCFCMFLFFLPVDSFPFWPISNQYRPISFVFILLVFLSYMTSLKITKNGLLCYFCTLFFCVYSMVMYYAFQGDVVLSSLLKFFVVSMLACIIFEGFHRHSNTMVSVSGLDVYLDCVTKVLMRAHLFLIPLFLIQLTARLGFGFDEVARYSTRLLSYRFVEGRVQLASGEASMMFRSFLLSSIFVFSFCVGGKRALFLVYFLFAIILSNSTYSLVLLIVFVLFYIVVFWEFKFRRTAMVLVTCVFLSGLALLYSNVSGEYAGGKIGIVVDLVSEPHNFFSLIAASGDGSAFQRLVNPFISFIILKDTLFLGGGAESYHLFYPAVIFEWFPYASSFESVSSVVSGESYITPKSLFSKVASDFGLLGLFLFCGLLVYLRVRIARVSGLLDVRRYMCLKLLFTYVVVCSLNQDSYMYLNTIIAISIIFQILKSGRYVMSHSK